MIPEIEKIRAFKLQRAERVFCEAKEKLQDHFIIMNRIKDARDLIESVTSQDQNQGLNEDDDILVISMLLLKRASIIASQMMLIEENVHKSLQKSEDSAKNNLKKANKSKMAIEFLIEDEKKKTLKRYENNEEDASEDIILSLREYKVETP